MRMMRMCAALSLLAASGCYHATIETGLAPSADTVTVPWAHGFVFGLVPPSPVSSASKCKSGVAKVETQLSFVNMLASFVTFSLYTPMTITVTCSTGQRASLDSTPTLKVGSDQQASVQQAVDLARESGKPVYLLY